MNNKIDISAEIEAKIAKRKKKKQDAADNKNSISIVFDFFKNAEEAKKISKDFSAKSNELIKNAFRSMRERLQSLDDKCLIKIKTDDLGNVLGVHITWSDHFCHKTNTEKEQHIEITDMLFG